MRRLTSAGYNAPGLGDREEVARAAAIASMGFRLAAAGPRTRRRLIDRETAQDPIDPARAPLPQVMQGLDVVPAPYVPFHEPELFDRPARSGAAANVRLFAALGAMAACGFGLVLVLQNPRWAAMHHGTWGGAIAAQAGAEFAALPDVEIKAAPPSIVTASLTPPPSVEVPAAKDSAPPRVWAVPAPPVAARMPTRYAAITRPPVHMSMMVRPVEGRPHPVAAEKFDLPRWLTEDHPPKPRVLVMSEPPHDLVPPPGAVEAHPASAPPRAVIYASPAASNPVTLRAPGYHPFYRAPYGTYYGPYYAPPPAYGDGRSTMAAGTTERAYPQAPTNGW